MTAKYIWGGGTDASEVITNTKLNQNVDYLDEQIAEAAVLGGQFAQDSDTTAALVFGYKGGNFRNDNAITVIADGTVTLTDDDTNYVEVDAAGVTANTAGFTSGKTPLYVIVTAGGAITSVEDKRSWAFLSNSPGDMLKSVYDTDNDGTVDAAESAPWSGITDKPSSFTPSAHAASHGDGGTDEIAIDASQITTGTMDKDRLPVMGGATSVAAGTSGMAPAPAAGDDTKVLFGDGTFKTPPGALGNVTSVNTRTGDVTLDSSDVGLGNVDNTSDADKPVSDATQTALDAKQDEFGIQSANRIFSGPSTGSAATPTFRALAKADLPALAVDDLSDVTISTPSSGQVLTYDGSDWVNDDASGGVALGETSTTAYRGDRGKTAYDHSQLTSGNPHNVTKSDVGLSNVDNTSNATERAATATLTNKDLSDPSNTFPTFNQDTTGNAATATKLATARTINGVAFDGTANITISASGASDSIEASEALTAGDIVNVFNSSGEKVRKANATNSTKPATGFVTANVSSAANATVYFAGSIITGLSGLTPGAAQYLDTTGGGMTETAPSGDGEIVQFLGTALSGTSMIFNPGVPFEL